MSCEPQGLAARSQHQFVGDRLRTCIPEGHTDKYSPTEQKLLDLHLWWPKLVPRGGLGMLDKVLCFLGLIEQDKRPGCLHVWLWCQDHV